MTTLSRPTALTAECWVCGIRLEALPTTRVAAGLQAFRAVHPMTGSVPHDRRLPAGWREPLSGPGCLSQ